MARQEYDREDLLRDATALVQRIELRSASTGKAESQTLFVGFRRDGCASIYFGSEPVYHFNASGQLRRAYIAGQLIKADSGRLVAMQRKRQAGEVQLQSRQLNITEQHALMGDMARLLTGLNDQLDAGDFEIVGQVPVDVDVLSRVRAWLLGIESITIARSPRVR